VSNPIEIFSKFSGKCTACGGAIMAGDRVLWTKGVKGVTHKQCPTPEYLAAVAADQMLGITSRLIEQIEQASDSALHVLRGLITAEFDRRKESRGAVRALPTPDGEVR
jgi:hypothetical protein